MIKASWSDESAFNLELALKESRTWIEAVVGQKFPSDDFQASVKDGVFLCKLINQIKPGIVPKINQQQSDFAKRENLTFFIKAAKQLGLKDTQLFDTNDVYESKRIRNTAISLYWLGRAARGISTYKGPQLNLLAFKKMNCSSCKKPIEDKNYLATLTQQWHTACAVCCNCSCNLDPHKPFYMDDKSNPWCSNCMTGAMKIGSGSGTSSPGTGKHKHDHSDSCSNCHGSLEKGYVPEGDQKFCAAKCICDLCKGPLLSDFSVIDGKKICNDCSCSSCGKSLQDGYFEDGLAKFCEPCAKKNQNKNNNSPSSSSKSPTHDHSHHNHPHDHGHKPTTTTTNNMNTNNNNNNNNKCKVCPTAIDKKPKKHNDRDKFCQPHEDERCCGKCDKEIVGSAIEAHGKNYHADTCFSCDKCQKKLGPKDTIKKSSTTGRPLCGPCATHSKGDCAGCNKPVTGGGLEALDDKVFHPACFKCKKCQKQLTGDYVDINNEAYCQPCSKSVPPSSSTGSPSSGGSPFITSGWGVNDKCYSCSKGLFGEVAKIQDVYYHKGCYHCQDCKCSLLTGYYPHDRKPYCKKCSDKIQESQSSNCSKCSKPIISGAIVKVGTHQYHKACFSCTTCNKQIGDGSTFTRFAKPYCRDCFNLQKLVCVKCRNQITDEYHESQDGKTYCAKCAPVENTHIHGAKISNGWTIDPRSGKKTFR
ncbi:LIM-type zinc finger-containing protein [Tieghemostelium lacteum]|uniref:LIM-type zinc finger-containing protein n=1 Tax=Tieghemostelium lacteum TaxID=361077 RepID=A0A152A9J2_TIELA|nr:LIM-type zinc finger-containing protein [Tieghemostelium lacteum]|eukprot:KYR02890.1 LIM-type zinc finger-containing protein [Tieghemostelium lacteum]